MSGIKGLVILTRFDFISNRFGIEALKKFQQTIEPQTDNLLRQPVVLSKDYPERLLKVIDETLTANLFQKNLEEFRTLGHWNAQNLLARYFQIYIDKQDVSGFLKQMVRMRPILIGLGDMQLSAFAEKSFGIHIHYGQPFSASVKLTELGFLEEGCRLCGAKSIQWEELEASDVSVNYQLNWE